MVTWPWTNYITVTVCIEHDTPLGQDVDAESKDARMCEEDDLLVEQWRKSVKVQLVRL